MKPIVIVNNDTLPAVHTNENITNNLKCDSGDYCVIRETMDGHVKSSDVKLGSLITEESKGTLHNAEVMIGDLVVPCVLWERLSEPEFNFIVVDNKYAI